MARTASQYMDSVWIRASWWTTVSPIGFTGVGGLAAAGCPDIGMWVTDEVNVNDISSGLVNSFSPRSSGWLDDDGAPLPNSYYRLREGIERFLITDINNPGASAKAQSEVFVMYDAWANTDNLSDDLGLPIALGVAFYNHVPGGSNVLYMDGHVEFVRYETKAPLIIKAQDPMALVTQIAGINWLMGGHG
ncbi:MAG: hypothetical protein KF886_13185 [Candidatus Hydrogenedentes bacterium]|nr:hypothetical protein [Candidatus Hydrogenedentota bacterium]